MMDSITHEKKEVLIHRCSMLLARVDSPSKIIKIGKNAYKLEFPNDNNILPTFNAKDLMPYHGKDLRVSLFSQQWGINVRASTTNIGNSIKAYKLDVATPEPDPIRLVDPDRNPGTPGRSHQSNSFIKYISLT